MQSHSGLFLGLDSIVIAALISLVGILLGYFIRVLWERHKLNVLQRQKTIEIMLPKIHEYVESYYMKISGSITFTLAEISTKNFNEAYYYFVMSEKYLRTMLDKIGAFYFRDHVGEMVLSELRERIVSQRRLFFGDEKITNLTSEVEVDEKYGTFLKKAKEGTMLLALRDKFINECKKEEKHWREYMNLQKTFEKILLFEINDVYLDWYKVKKPIRDIDVCNNINSILDTLIRKQSIKPGRKITYLNRISRA